MNETTYDLAPARKDFSRLGFALTAISVVATILQALWFALPERFFGPDNWMTSSSWGFWLGSFVPLYAVAIPVGLLILKPMPAKAPQRYDLRFRDFLVLLPICFCLMYGGNIIGTILSMLLSGGTAQNAVAELAMDNNPLKVVVMVILAPLLEEYVCRKQLIDRLGRYGEKTTVILSGLTFGLLHQNLFQFFYAFALGLVFAYVYTRTGKLRYSVILHSIINFMGSVVAPWILTLVDMETLTALENLDPNMTDAEFMAQFGDQMLGLVVYMGYVVLLLGLFVIGLILLILKAKHLAWLETPEQLPEGTRVKTVYWNVGMVVYIVLCLVFFVLALL